MSKALSAQNALNSGLHKFKERASAAKEAHRSARRKIKEDPMTSDLAKSQRLADLDEATRAKLDAIKAEQKSFEVGLREKAERELRGNQPTDANSVLLRRDAADRVRKITNKREAMEMLNDAIANGDHILAHAIGTRARNTGMVSVAEKWRGAYPDSADAAEALAYIEDNTSGGEYNLSNSITYSSPL